MIQRIDDFLAVYAAETELTKKVLAHLTDASLSERVPPKGRTLGFLAWHLAVTIREMLGSAGLDVSGPDQDAPAPSSAREIAHAYAAAAASVAPALRARWKDADLAGMIPMYGEQWPRRQVLLCLLMHEAHHRGQMTVLMRQAGLKVPGIYGPAAEEWAAMGLPAMP